MRARRRSTTSRRPTWSLVATFALAACAGNANPDATTPPGPSTPSPPPTSPAPVPDTADAQIPDTADAQAPAVRSNRACAEVTIGLDLRALPTGTTTQDITRYTRARADELRNMAGPSAAPLIYIAEGVSTFRAELFADTERDAIATCRDVSWRFIPTVPGHPLSREPGGSIMSPCRPCARTIDAGATD